MPKSGAREILLLGDLVRHVLLCPESGAQGHYVGHVRDADQPLLKLMLEAALGEKPVAAASGAPAGGVRILPSFDAAQRKGGRDPRQWAAEVHSLLGYFPRKSSSKADDPKVLRIKSEQIARVVRTSTGAELAKVSEESSPVELLKYFVDEIAAATKGKPASDSHRVTLLYDRNSHFSCAVAGAGDATISILGELLLGSSGGILVAAKDDITSSWIDAIHDRIKRLTKSSRLKHQWELVRRRSVAVVTADALRKCGLRIMENGAIESSINDIVAQLGSPPLSRLLNLCGQLVVIFRETGALHIDLASEIGSLSYCPNFDRHAQSHPNQFGSAPGKLTVAVVAIARELCRTSIDAAPGTPDDMAAALRLAVAAYNVHFSEGYPQGAGNGEQDSANERRLDGRNSGQQDPFDAYRQVLCAARRSMLDDLARDTRKSDFLVTTVRFDLARAARRAWHRYDCLFDAPASTSPKDMDGELTVLVRIVKSGIDRELRTPLEPHAAVDPRDLPRNGCPGSAIRVPYAAFGNLRLVEYEEIEKYNNLAKLIGKYIDDSSWTNPLSIAVFGSPGAGKSFAVKQVLKRVSPGRRSDPLTFNLAQFNSVEQLTEAFHKVQDRALSSDEVPLVIFDEFDANFHMHLGWLKYFLAPMQDGLFRGRGEDYRVGRAIFLFSGGTSTSFQEFRTQKHNRALDAAARSAAKLNDFISRLRGYLDVGDINAGTGRAAAQPEAQRCIRLRRAFVLRALLKEHAPGILEPAADGSFLARIDEPIVRAFLTTRRFEHGVRSMEAVIRMSRWIEGHFVAASLPAKEQLEIHVHLGSFFEALSHR